MKLYKVKFFDLPKNWQNYVNFQKFNFFSFDTLSQNSIKLCREKVYIVQLCNVRLTIEQGFWFLQVKKATRYTGDPPSLMALVAKIFEMFFFCIILGKRLRKNWMNMWTDRAL